MVLLILKKIIINRLKNTASEAMPEGGHVFLYGSRARGDARDDSDWDVLVLLDKPKIEQSDYDGICYKLTDLGWEMGEMIIPVLYTKDEWEKSSYTPFYKNVQRERILLV